MIRNLDCFDHNIVVGVDVRRIRTHVDVAGKVPPSYSFMCVMQHLVSTRSVDSVVSYFGDNGATAEKYDSTLPVGDIADHAIISGVTGTMWPAEVEDFRQTSLDAFDAAAERLGNN